MQLQVGQAVFVFQILLVIQRGLADVDPDDVCVRIAEREDGGLVGATPLRSGCRDPTDSPGLARRCGAHAPGRTSPSSCAPRRQVLDRRWVSPTLVLAADHISARVVVHLSDAPSHGSGPGPRRSTRGIIGYPPPGGNPAMTRRAHIAVCDVRLFWRNAKKSLLMEYLCQVISVSVGHEVPGEPGCCVCSQGLLMPLGGYCLRTH